MSEPCRSQWDSVRMRMPADGLIGGASSGEGQGRSVSRWGLERSGYDPVVTPAAPRRRPTAGCRRVPSRPSPRRVCSRLPPPASCGVTASTARTGSGRPRSSGPGRGGTRTAHTP
jgi:hypothetical protein